MDPKMKLFTVCLLLTSTALQGCIQAPVRPTEERQERADMGPSPVDQPDMTSLPEPVVCQTSSDCEVGTYCAECAASSCPNCQDCINHCLPSSCESEEQGCEIDSPDCGRDLVLIMRDGCWDCVDPDTCLSMPFPTPAPEPINCEVSADCPAGAICYECAQASCLGCDDCIPGCQPVCQSEPAPLCNMIKPECEIDQVAVVRGDCWACVNQATCEP